jgi:HPt (histidine-containing phosphotransfer) domain-containing protein
MEVKTYQHLNLEYLELMTSGDAEMKKMMLDILFEELPVEIEMLSTHYAAAAWDDLKSVSHKLKSTLAFIGNEPMTTANDQIEHNAMYVEHTDKIPGLISTVKEMSPLVLEELNGYYAGL